MTHTKLPWTIKKRTLDILVIGPEPTLERSRKIAELPQWTNPEYGQVEEEAEANAKLICKAVNSHDALVSALEDMIDGIKATDGYCAWASEIRSAENVLKLAKESK